MGSAAHLRAALEAGAAGIQVGTLFAFCEESGLDPALRASVLAHAMRGEVDVLTNAQASPTGYPFKVVDWAGNPAAAGPASGSATLATSARRIAPPMGRSDTAVPANRSRPT